MPEMRETAHGINNGFMTKHACGAARWLLYNQRRRKNLANVAGSGSMKSCEINVFKCIVNISSQDFGIYRNWKPKFGVGSKAEQHGVVEALVVKPEEDVMESESGVFKLNYYYFILIIFICISFWLYIINTIFIWDL